MTKKISLTLKEATWIAYRLHDFIKGNPLSKKRGTDVAIMRDRILRKVRDAKDSEPKPIEVVTDHGKYVVVWDETTKTDQLMLLQDYKRTLKALYKAVRKHQSQYESVVEFVNGTDFIFKLVNTRTGETTRVL